MFGWNIILKKSDNQVKNIRKSVYEDKYVFIDYKPHFKFEEDKVFYEDDKLVLGLDGVIFNKSDLLNINNVENWGTCLVKMYKNDKKFFSELKGTFNGFVYEKKDRIITSFTNHLGDRPLFYYDNKDMSIISSNFNDMSKILVKNKIKYSLSENAIKFMLTYGFMLDDTTYIAEVKRLMPGSFIFIDKKLIVEKYFEFGVEPEIANLDNEDIINEIDRLFNKALKFELDKDKEYGYKSILDISGGLDSRTVNYVAKKLGYKNVINLSYSQIGSYEQYVTQELVKDLGYDYIYKALDNASFLKEIDEMINMNYGLSIYSGITGGKQFLEVLSNSRFGIEHTGLLGDVADGTFEFNDYHSEPEYDGKYRFSNILSDDILPKEVLKKYKNKEMFYFYTRGILAGVSTHMIRRNYTETYSPFEDIDFLKFSHSIPLNKRVNEKIFRKWLIEKYPEATKVVYDKTMCKIDANKIEIFLKKIRMRGLENIKFRLGLKKEKENIKGMNPYDYWYKNNLELREFIQQYYEENIFRLNDNKEMKLLIEKVYKEGKMIDKMCVLTVLGTLKAYF